MNAILKVENLSKTYENSHFKLRDVSFSIPYGSIVGFVGENGAGKTTTMGMILGTLKKDSGSIILLGENIDQTHKSIKENVGVVFDNMNFSGNLTTKMLSKVMKNIYKTWDVQKFAYYTKRFSLPSHIKIKNFSRGMSMKLSIAVAMSHDPKLLILDEATSGLDPVVREEILDIFHEFVEDQQHSILLSSHIISDIAKIADHLIFIKNGEIILDIAKNELLSSYKVIECEEGALEELNNKIVRTYKNKRGKVDVLVAEKNEPTSDIEKYFSIDEITMLLLKGETI